MHELSGLLIPGWIRARTLQRPALLGIVPDRLAVGDDSSIHPHDPGVRVEVGRGKVPPRSGRLGSDHAEGRARARCPSRLPARETLTVRKWTWTSTNRSVTRRPHGSLRHDERRVGTGIKTPEAVPCSDLLRAPSCLPASLHSLRRNPTSSVPTGPCTRKRRPGAG